MNSPRGNLLLELIQMKIFIKPLPFYTPAYLTILRSVYCEKCTVLFKGMFNMWFSLILNHTEHQQGQIVVTGGRTEATVKGILTGQVCLDPLSALAFQMSRNPSPQSTLSLIWFSIRWISYNLKWRFYFHYCFLFFLFSVFLIPPSLPCLLCAPPPSATLSDIWGHSSSLSLLHEIPSRITFHSDLSPLPPQTTPFSVSCILYFCKFL